VVADLTLLIPLGMALARELIKLQNAAQNAEGRGEFTNSKDDRRRKFYRLPCPALGHYDSVQKRSRT
jgi:hypothetical protein